MDGVDLTASAERPALVTGCLVTPLALVAGGLWPRPVGTERRMPSVGDRSEQSYEEE